MSRFAHPKLSAASTKAKGQQKAFTALRHLKCATGTPESPIWRETLSVKVKAGQAAPSPSSHERLEQSFTHGPNGQNLHHASRSELALASEYREPASKHTNISIDTCIHTYRTRTRKSVNDRRQLITEATRVHLQPSLQGWGLAGVLGM